MARPSKLNYELIEQFAEEISKGLSVQHTCDLLCVTQPCYNNWMRQGEEDLASGNDDSLFAQFFLEIKKSHAMYVRTARDILNSCPKNWQSIAWWLERTDRSFMPKQEITAGDDGKVTVVLGGKVNEVKK